MRTFLLLALASVAFATGGIFMKLAEGLTRPWPSAMVAACFLLGAGLQTVALRRHDLSTGYVLVLGLEAILAFGFGVALFGEAVTVSRVAAIGFIVAGIALLR